MHFSITTLALLALAACGAGLVNALAGGGIFIVFPALLLAGVTPIKANATASLVVLPGSMIAAWVYRHSLKEHSAGLIARLVGCSLAGSAAGSMLLLRTSNATFTTLVPWLLLLAATFFTFAGSLRKAAANLSGHRSQAALLGGQFVIALYGGYFGAGMGVLLIVLYLATAGMTIHSASSLRLICASVTNLLAVAVFAGEGALEWSAGMPMLVAGVFAAYWAARLVKGMNEQSVRRWILVYAWALTAYFFVKPLLAR